MASWKSLLAGGLALAALGAALLSCNKGGATPGGITSGPGASLAARLGIAPEPVKQPLRFDHAVHIKAEDMDCKDCHKFAEKGVHATLPKLKDCKDCHSEPQGKDPEEPKVREYLESGKEIPWVVVDRMPGHVYFSHRAHIALGKMKCWDCHRDMRKVNQPVTVPDINYLTMSKCTACHKQKQAEWECTTCHK